MAKVSIIPLDQFFPFGVDVGDVRLSLDDSASLPIAVSTPFTILGRQRNFLHVSYSKSSPPSKNSDTP